MTDNPQPAAAANGDPLGSRKDSLSTATSLSPTSNPQTSAAALPVKKRRKVNHACVYCRRSHMTCDEDRPCSRCVKRNIGHLCHDEPREPKKPKSEVPHENGQIESKLAPAKSELVSVVNCITPVSEQQPTITSPLATSMPPPRSTIPSAPTILAPSPVSGSSRSLLNANQQAFLGLTDWDFAKAGQPSWIANPYHNQWMFSANEAADEFNAMSDWVGNFHEGELFGGELFGFHPHAASTETMNDLPKLGGNQQEGLAPPPPLPSIVRPASVKPTEKARDIFYLTAADPSKESPEDKMKQVLRAKYQAGLLKPFNYVKGYSRLYKYMENNYQPSSRQKIARQLEKFRPKFRDRTQKLTDLDLVSVEEWFEKTMMEYDRVFASMAVPACLWRRTGEIFRGNREFAELIDVRTEDLRDGKLALYELIAEESFFCYWEKFGSIAFDTSQKAMLTSCLLKNPDPHAEAKYINCCFSFTIRRDAYDIPCAIVGNFIPIS